MDVGELVRAAAAGDEGALDQARRALQRTRLGGGSRPRLNAQDAGDVVQTTWLRLVEHLDRLHDPERVGAWLATTVRHESLRVLRLSARHVLTPTELLPDEGEDVRLDASLLVSERDRELWRAFVTLPERCQALLRLLVADPAPSYEQVSAALDMPIGSIGPTRARCLAHLRERAAARGVSYESSS